MITGPARTLRGLVDGDRVREREADDDAKGGKGAAAGADSGDDDGDDAESAAE